MIEHESDWRYAITCPKCGDLNGFKRTDVDRLGELSNRYIVAQRVACTKCHTFFGIWNPKTTHIFEESNPKNGTATEE